MQPDTASKMIKKLLISGGYSVAKLAHELQVAPIIIEQWPHGEPLSLLLEQKLIRLYCKTNFISHSAEY